MKTRLYTVALTAGLLFGWCVTLSAQAMLAVSGVTVDTDTNIARFTVTYAGITSYTVDLIGAGGAVVLTRTRPQSGTLPPSPCADAFSITGVPDGDYTLRVSSGSLVSTAPFKVARPVVTPTPTPTPIPTPTPTPTPSPTPTPTPTPSDQKLDQIQLTVDQIKSLLTQPPPSLGSPCTLTATLFKYVDGRVRVTCAVSPQDALALGWVNALGNFTLTTGQRVQVK